ncbi:SDR family NAD(P)-dependent oxidoreductase [Burkholderia gladioli]|uniref:Putative dehydrogenasereductase protein n=1 Tax=Burkholderia gladioli (strain BSR3) TaxID=999541 RepID=F2LB71_BURGS|nr:SDR family NAD(P)-dependent oxidoreductase [Burkholderia gladioli]AEA60140.1 putative dehydrogenasereductase protein [Burkholderia gladioli BSR3]
MQRTPLTIITGGSRGIGRDLLRPLLERTDVLSLSRSEIDPASIEASEHRLFQLQCDLTQVDRTIEGLDQWLAEHSSHIVDTFISCAAVLDLCWLSKTDTLSASFDRAFQINALAPIAISSHINRINRFRDDGARILYVTSSLARPVPALTFAGLGLYSATKSALERLAQIQAREFDLSSRKTKVVLAHPGIVDTDMQRELRASDLMDPAFAVKTAGLPAYQEGDWDRQAPDTAMRTISPRFSADFLMWIVERNVELLDPYYDFYTASGFHGAALQSVR